MNIVKGILVVGAAASTLTVSNMAFAAATTATFSITATILAVLTATNTRGLDFGQVVQTPAASVVTVAPTDPGSAQFNVSGPAGKVATFSVSGVTQLNCASGGCAVGTDKMNVGTFTFGGGFTGSTMTIPAGGTITAGAVGATLSLGAAQPIGVYSNTGTFNVSYP